MAVSPVDIEILQDSALGAISNTYSTMSSDDFHDLHGIYEKNQNARFDGFNRYGLIYPDDEIDNFITYVFMVRPDLNIVHFNGGASSTRTAMLSESAQADPVFNYFFQTAENRELLEMLSADYSSYHDFVPFLVGRTKSMPIQDFEIRNDAVGQLFSNYKYYILGKADESTSGISFSMDFRDDKDLSVAKFFYLWEYYIHQVMDGQIYANDVYRKIKLLIISPASMSSCVLLMVRKSNTSQKSPQRFPLGYLSVIFLLTEVELRIRIAPSRSLQLVLSIGILSL